MFFGICVVLGAGGHENDRLGPNSYYAEESGCFSCGWGEDVEWKGLGSAKV